MLVHNRSCSRINFVCRRFLYLRWVCPFIAFVVVVLFFLCCNLALNQYGLYFFSDRPRSAATLGNLSAQNNMPFQGRIVVSRAEERYQLLEQVYHSADVFRLNYKEMELKFKIFVYPDDETAAGGGDATSTLSYYYHTPCSNLTDKNCATDGFFFHNLQESQFVTNDSESAHLFFIPVISCHKMRGKGASNGEKSTDIVKRYVENLIFNYPYWNRTLGADHFFVTCCDVAVILQPIEELAQLLKNSIWVACSPSYNGTTYVPHKDVSLPRALKPFPLPAAQGDDTAKRTILGFWAGHRNSKVREMLTQTWQKDPVLFISNNRISRASGELVYQKQFFRSKFCVCPVGSHLSSARISESIHYGCVPVIMSDFYDLPFNDVLNWPKFSLVLKEKNYVRLKEFLLAVSAKDYSLLMIRVQQVQQHFQWHTPAIKYDAFHMVMYELWLRHFTIRY